ncbi:MAG TPA: acetate kinase [Chloroflexia bacterium]|nr:acetate kinase [Chloroflexia bacterium]
MRVLVFNCGSSTLKFELMDVSSTDATAVARLANGLVDKVGGQDASLRLQVGEGQPANRGVSAGNYREAAVLALDGLREAGLADIDAVGHRVVHGGDRFVMPTRIDDDVLTALDGLSELAPLHNPPALEGIRAAREVLGPSVPMVAVFDTAFHSTLPEVAYTYALPHDLAAKYGIRRYGFHGIAHEYMLMRYSDMTNGPISQSTIVTLQLGNGCSACAIRGGRSMDTSMGFTPLEGLVMGTRSGDLDPGIVGWLAEHETTSAETVVDWLNKRSGLLGLSGTTSDMRTLLSKRQSDPAADLAIEVFAYRVRKYIGAYMAALGDVGGAQALVFGGGIGEHAPYVRERILAGMEWCGLKLDPNRNNASAANALISADDSPRAIYVVAVDEELLIARRTWQVIEHTS